MKTTKLVLAAGGAVALLGLALAGLAAGAEISRDEYRARVEPICQQNARANERILAGVRADVRRGKLRLAGAKFAKAAVALKKTYRQLAAVPEPSADETKLARWLSDVKLEATLFAKAAQALRAGDKGRAQNYVVKLSHNATLANSSVLAFEFHYCRFEPSKFT